MAYYYEDRKKLKWMGFYLSEHTAATAEQDRINNYVVPAKEHLTPEEISKVLNEAIIKSKQVAVQINDVIDGKFLPDTVGMISGHDSRGVYVGTQFIEYELIRNVEFFHEKKWSDLH